MWIFRSQDVEKLRIKGKVKGLIKLLEDDDDEVRASAAEALGDFDDLEVINALLKTLKDKNREVRWRAAKSLEYLCKEKPEILIHAFAHSNSVLQKVSLAWLLGRIGDKRAIPALAEALRFGDKYVRRASIISMGRIRDETTIPHLINALKDYDADVRKRAAEALGRIRIKRDDVVKALVNSLFDEDRGVRRAAAKSLERLGWEPESDEELAAYLAALRMGSELMLLGEVAVEPLIIALQDADWSVKKWASEVLGEIKSDKVLKRLVEVLDTDDWAVKVHALKALSKMGKDGIAFIARFLDDPDPSVREAAVDAFRDCLRECEPEERKRVIEELIETYPSIKERIKDIKLV